MINIDFRSGQPLYRQVKENFKRLILSGGISENEKLPSVRELAALLTINPNTIQRAYRELEIEGFIGSTPGRGVYAAGGDELKERRVEETFNAIFAEIKSLLDIGWDGGDILKRIQDYIKETSINSKIFEQI